MSKKSKIASLVVLPILLIGLPALAETEIALKQVQAYSNKWILIAIAAVLGIPAAFGALGQAKAASSALEGIARNPGAADKMFTPMLLSLALIESLVIYGLVISIMLYLKLVSL